MTISNTTLVVLVVVAFAMACGTPSAPLDDAGIDAAIDIDGGAVPTCPPVLECDHITASESPSDTP